MTLLDKIRNKTATYILGAGLLAFGFSCGTGNISPEQQTQGCHVSTDCKGDRVCYQGECVNPEELENLVTEDVTEENVSNVQPHDPGCNNGCVLYDDFTNQTISNQQWDINEDNYDDTYGWDHSFSDTGILLTNGCLISKDYLDLNLNGGHTIEFRYRAISDGDIFIQDGFGDSCEMEKSMYFTSLMEGYLRIGSLHSPNPGYNVPTNKWVYVKYERNPDFTLITVNTPDDEIKTHISENLDEEINLKHIVFTCSSYDNIACEIDYIKVENK